MAQPVVSSMSDPESATKDVLSKESLKHFISSLPARDGWLQPLILYKNYWFRPKMLKEILLVKQAFVHRVDDIILATQPKCGTTWLKALAFTITNRSRYSFKDHPLLTHHPQYVVPFIEIPAADGANQTDIDALPSPRLLTTHLPMSLLPPSLGCRVVYLSMDSAFSMFCEGFSSFGPFWDHCLEYWKESVARPNNVLFLKYEEIKSDPVDGEEVS